MQLSVETIVNAPQEKVWATVTDIEHCANVISAIVDLKILAKPDDGIIGLKWTETRLMFGKSASETMWITDAVAPSYYCTRAESHGSVYLTKIMLSETADGATNLVMSFTAEPQSIGIKVMSILMAPIIKGAMIKALQQDLNDIKNYVEALD